MGPTSGEAGEVFGRFEAAHANQRWVGDALHGPKLFGKRTYLFAFLDDHARLLTGYRFAFAEDTLRMSWALKNGLTSRGVPESIYVDNGAPYVDAWLLRACGKLRIRLIHSTPNRPQGKGKIERFFRTVRDQFLVELTGQEVAKIEESAPDHAAGLAEMNRLFSAWVETVYHHNIHSETKQKPLDRWDAFWAKAGHRPPLPAGDDLAEAFRWSEHRTVRKTATVSLHSNTYEVDPALVGRRVELVFSLCHERHRGALPGQKFRGRDPARDQAPYPSQSQTRNPTSPRPSNRDRLPAPRWGGPPRTVPHRSTHQLPRPDPRHRRRTHRRPHPRGGHRR